VHDHGAPNRGLLIVGQRNLMVHILQCCFSRSVCFYISHVADVPLGIVRPGMRFVCGIKVRPGGTCICRAAIAEFMNVKTMISRRKPRYVCVDLYAVGDLSKSDSATYFVARCRMKHRNRL